MNPKNQETLRKMLAVLEAREYQRQNPLDNMVLYVVTHEDALDALREVIKEIKP